MENRKLNDYEITSSKTIKRLEDNLLFLERQSKNEMHPVAKSKIQEQVDRVVIQLTEIFENLTVLEASSRGVNKIEVIDIETTLKRFNFWVEDILTERENIVL